MFYLLAWLVVILSVTALAGIQYVALAGAMAVICVIQFALLYSSLDDTTGNGFWNKLTVVSLLGVGFGAGAAFLNIQLIPLFTILFVAGGLVRLETLKRATDEQVD